MLDVNANIFAMPFKKDKEMSACVAMKKYTDKYNVPNCTSTSLRKYLATTMQGLALSDEDKEKVSMISLNNPEYPNHKLHQTYFLH